MTAAAAAACCLLLCAQASGSLQARRKDGSSHHTEKPTMMPSVNDVYSLVDVPSNKSKTRAKGSFLVEEVFAMAISSREDSSSQSWLYPLDNQGRKESDNVTSSENSKKTQLAPEVNKGIQKQFVTQKPASLRGEKDPGLAAPLQINNLHKLLSVDIFHPAVLHHKIRSLADPHHSEGAGTLGVDSHSALDQSNSHSNRPGKTNSLKFSHTIENATKPSWMTNRQPSSLLYHFNILKKDPDNKEKLCLTECKKDRDERAYYCTSEFAVNGIVHDVEMLGRGARLVTLLVNSEGLYKMSRLYISPDGYFFRIKILAIDTSDCRRPCPDFKLGSRYIVMGEIYHKRVLLPPSILQFVKAHLRSGDGLVRSSSYVKRFNKKKNRKVQSVTHTKCR